MTEWHDVANLQNLKTRKRLLVEVEGIPIALFYINENVYALHDVCIHKANHLSKGTVMFGKVICPGHQWKFDPATGEPDGQEGCQPTYPVRISEDGTVAISTKNKTPAL